MNLSGHLSATCDDETDLPSEPTRRAVCTARRPRPDPSTPGLRGILVADGLPSPLGLTALPPTPVAVAAGQGCIQRARRAACGRDVSRWPTGPCLSRRDQVSVVHLDRRGAGRLSGLRHVPGPTETSLGAGNVVGLLQGVRPWPASTMACGRHLAAGWGCAGRSWRRCAIPSCGNGTSRSPIDHGTPTSPPVEEWILPESG